MYRFLLSVFTVLLSFSFSPAQDNIPPVAVCNAKENISLNGNPTKVLAKTFDDGSWDETCLSHFLVKRKFEPESAFKSFIEFTCADIAASPIKVMLRVVDCSGNYNDCWGDAFIEDKLKPFLLCPADKTINCDEDPTKLFGTPVATDNCSPVTITFQTIDNTNQCSQGFVSRTFQGKDASGNIGFCTQNVYKKHVSDFFVQFPADVTLTSCINPSELQNTGVPIYTGVDCELLAVEKIDHTFTVTGDGCFFIQRKWKIISWCNYDKINNPNPTKLGIPAGLRRYKDDDGFFEYTQNILVFESSNPQLTCKDTLVSILDNSCAASFNINKPAVIDCSNKITYQLSGDLGDNYSLKDVPPGIYNITHVVQDGCGNFSTCSVKISVLDKKKPTPICYNGLSAPTMPVQKKVTIWANDWETGSSYDNCCPLNQMIHRIEKTKNSNGVTVPDSTSVTFDCTEIGQQAVRVWLGDCGFDVNNDGKISEGERNWDFCETFINISDNDMVCAPQDSIFNVTFSIVEASGTPVQGIDLSGKLFNSTSDINGVVNASLDSIAKAQLLNISAPLNKKSKVSVADLLVIKDHILGVKFLTDSLKIIAADVDNNQLITVADLLGIVKFILSQVSSPSLLGKYTFLKPVISTVDSNSTQINYLHLGHQFDFSPKKFNVNDTTRLICLEMGDVGFTNNLMANSSNEARSVLPIELRKTENGQFELVYVGEQTVSGAYIEAMGIQDLISLNPDQEFTYKTTNSIQWIATHDLLPGAVLLKIEALNNLSDKNFDGYLVTKDLEHHNIQIKNTELNTLSVSDFMPNPSDGYTQLTINLPEASNMSVSLFTSEGKLVRTPVVEQNFSAGTHIIQLKEKLISGPYIAVIKTNFGEEIRKIIIKQ